jgi:hypothetical protein
MASVRTAKLKILPQEAYLFQPRHKNLGMLSQEIMHSSRTRFWRANNEEIRAAYVLEHRFTFMVFACHLCSIARTFKRNSVRARILSFLAYGR